MAVLAPIAQRWVKHATQPATVREKEVLAMEKQNRGGYSHKPGCKCPFHPKAKRSLATAKRPARRVHVVTLSDITRQLLELVQVKARQEAKAEIKKHFRLTA